MVTLALETRLLSATLVARIVTFCEPEMFCGAVYSPLLEIDPMPDGLVDHVTFMLVEPVTLAVNCWLFDDVKLAVAGLTDTLTSGPTPMDSRNVKSPGDAAGVPCVSCD